jgi:hypothetical protein
MIRFLQSLLTLAILFQAWSLIQLGISISDMNRVNEEVNPTLIGETMKNMVPAGGATLRFTVRKEVPTIPFALGRMALFNSDRNELRQIPYLILNNVSPPVRVGDEFYVLGDQGERMKVEYDEKRMATGIAIPEKKFSRLLIVETILFTLLTGLIAYFSFQLFQFCRHAGNDQFFVPQNRKRLRLIGGFIMLTGIFSFFRQPFTMWLAGKLTGYDQWQYHVNESVFHPYWIIAGLLLLVIAEAFRKGNQLQTEQEYTI